MVVSARVGYRWLEPEPIADGSPGSKLAKDRLLSEILARRGFERPADAESFLVPQLENLNNPRSLPDMQRAIERVHRAIARGETIAVFGDYDADGITSTALLTHALRGLGADVRPHLPHRIEDGYGLRPAAVARLAEDRPSLLIAVDCGSHDIAGLEAARAHGIETIVLDHHHVGESSARLPALAFVSPRRPDSSYPFPDLAAAGLAFQFARVLVGDEQAEPLLPLAALGTVADVVPLLGDNRIIVKQGLSRFAEGAAIGLPLLAREAGIDPATVESWHLAYVLGPRVNAAGRIDDPRLALDLLLTDDVDEAQRLARQLGALNARRQRTTARMLDEAEAMAALQSPDLTPVLALAHADWHVGLVGLVASRLVERYHRPAIVLSQGVIHSRGSARSIDGFNIVEALSACADLLLEHGGHSHAAGLTIETERLAALRERLSERFQGSFPHDVPDPVIRIDAELAPTELTLRTHARVSRLEPCGAGNLTPVFMTRGLRPRDVRLSKDGRHLLFSVLGRDGRELRAVFFGAGSRGDELAGLDEIDLAYNLKRDTWRNRVRLELAALDFRRSTVG